MRAAPLRRALPGLDQVHPDDRQQDTDTGDGDGGHHGLHLKGGVQDIGGRPERAGRQDGAAIGLEEVRSHAGDIADVVPDVVRDHGRIAWVVLRDAGLDLAHQIGTYVRGLGEDAAADAREHGLHRSTHAEGQDGGGDQHHADTFPAAPLRDQQVGQDEPDHDVAEPEPDHHQPHDGTASEGDLQGLGKGGAGGGGGARGRLGRGLHAEIAGQGGEEPAGDEGGRQPRALHAQAKGQQGKHGGEHDEHDDHDPILLAQVGQGAATHIGADALHGLGALVLAPHLGEKAPSEKHGQKGGHGCNPKQGFIHDLTTTYVSSMTRLNCGSGSLSPCGETPSG
jgi:hypothetical protein